MSEEKYASELRRLGAQIQKFRKQKNLTQLDLEISCGISRADISKIENGLKNIEVITVIKIAEALDVETYKLFLPDQNS